MLGELLYIFFFSKPFVLQSAAEYKFFLLSNVKHNTLCCGVKAVPNSPAPLIWVPHTPGGS